MLLYKTRVQVVGASRAPHPPAKKPSSRCQMSRAAKFRRLAKRSGGGGAQVRFDEPDFDNEADYEEEDEREEEEEEEEEEPEQRW